jgi:hypothetical protein
MDPRSCFTSHVLGVSPGDIPCKVLMEERKNWPGCGELKFIARESSAHSSRRTPCSMLGGASRRPSHRQASASTSVAAITEDVAMQDASSSAPVPHSGPASVAVDLGSYTIRICIAGTDGQPDIITRCPNALVRPSQKRYSGSASNGLLAGPQIAEKCTNYGSLSIRQPMDRGMIVDWPTQKLILDAALINALSKEKPGSKSEQRLLEGREVIVTEAYLNLPDLQAGLDVLFLEGYGASKIWRCARECHCLSLERSTSDTFPRQPLC